MAKIDEEKLDAMDDKYIDAMDVHHQYHQHHHHHHCHRHRHQHYHHPVCLNASFDSSVPSRTHCPKNGICAFKIPDSPSGDVNASHFKQYELFPHA